MKHSTIKEMSTGFTGGGTRTMKSFEREIDKRLDLFTDEFSPPGIAEGIPAIVAKKNPINFADKHTDISSADSTSALAAAGNAKDQEELDMIDEIEDKFQKPIKKYEDQFPGSKLSASDNAGFDVHQTDPARLRGESGFNREVNRRMAKLKASVSGTTTVAVISDNLILMGKRRDNGKWTMPGGGLNEGEVPLMGAIRELKEEAGLDASSLDFLGDELVSGRTGRMVNVYCYRLNCKKCPTMTFQDPDQEVSSWEWIDISGGLPSEIKDNLQSPKNILLIKLGLL